MFKRFLTLHPDQRYPNLVFVSTFLVLNCLLFLPLYLLGGESGAPDAAGTIFGHGWQLALQRIFLWRESLDPLRISLELTILLALWVNVRRLQRPLMRYAIVAVYLITLAYAIYEAVIRAVYRTDPVFYSQYYLARDGLPFLAEHVQASLWLYVGALVGFGVALAAVITLVNLLLTSAASRNLAGPVRISVTLLAAFCVYAGIRHQYYTARPEMVVSSLGFKVQQNIADSRRLYADIASFDDRAARRAYDYAQFPLARKPDIYLIFVESYGSVLLKRPDYRRAYTSLLAEIEAALQKEGWYSTSTLSNSPTWGGGSWMAYTSVIFGLRIDSHPQYLSLLNKYQVQRYPDLGRYFQSQDYYYTWVSSISDELDDATWLKYIRFLGVDQWLRYRDLDYQGARYGWGPAPPDQYTINYANELIQAKTGQPLLFMTITQNSHYPWTPQPTMAADWHTLNQPTPELTAPPADEIATATKRQNYLQAITYQLQMLSDFILHSADEKSLIILIGDHQPPQVSRRADGWATPIHIVSKDRALVEAFAAYGFTPGLLPATAEASLNHEGFYSLLMRVLIANGSADRIALPNYLPHGVHAGEAAPNTQMN